MESRHRLREALDGQLLPFLFPYEKRGIDAPAVACTPTPTELLRSDANALLTIDPPGVAAQNVRWVWLASARPGALEALLPSAFPDYNGIRSGLRRFEWVDLKLRITDQGDIQGDLVLRLNPLPPGAK